MRISNAYLVNALAGTVVQSVKRAASYTMQCETVLGRARLKRDGTRAETRFGLSAKRTRPFKLAGGGGGQFRVDYWRVHQR